MIRYAITDRSRLARDEPARKAALMQQAARLASEGVDFLLLRERDLNAASLSALAGEILATLRAHSPDPSNPSRLLIHSRPDIAIATQADGVHLTSAPESLIPTDVRRVYQSANLPAPVISISCHTLEEVARACSGDPDPVSTLILFGPVFEKVASADGTTESFLSHGTGLDLLRAACRTASPVPILALGGVTTENTAACLAAGAAGIAAIRLFQRPTVDSRHQP